MFITFEGPEGSGKSSVLNEITQRFINEGYAIVKTREPGGTEIAEQIRNVILDVDNVKMDSITEAMLYAASRRQHLVEKVIPYLEQGYIVLCDRFIDSSLAYQGHARGIGIEEVYNMNMFATEGFMPHLTIYLLVDPKIGLERKSHQKELDRLEKEKLEFSKKHTSDSCDFLCLSKILQSAKYIRV